MEIDSIDLHVTFLIYNLYIAHSSTSSFTV
jgi:hypothetical protein